MSIRRHSAGRRSSNSIDPSWNLYSSATETAGIQTFPTKNYDSDSRFFWDFKGHSCYAVISNPINRNKNKNLLDNMSSLLPALSSIDGNSNTKTDTKPVVVLVHGFACSTVYWRETKKYLQNSGYTVHAVDLLGQGKSTKPGRSSSPPINYSIDLWAEMVDEYSRRYIGTTSNRAGIVLVGNSLGSLVTLSAATGDWKTNKENDLSPPAFLPSKVRGLCFYNCGIGMNSRNLLKTISQPWLKSILTVVFDVFDALIFDNRSLLTYVIDNQVKKDVIKNALISLYKYADDPENRVDDELVDSFFSPVTDDTTDNVVEVLRQIYTNDAGKTPMELHEKHFMMKRDQNFVGNNNIFIRPLPIHLIWGDKDTVTPLGGPVGKFYSDLATSNDNGNNNMLDVSMQVVRAGHVPFDERPECNKGLIEWLDQISVPKVRKYEDKTSLMSSSLFRWPFF
jgi:pimeloyl-ACP methyl ester carboxylesterase